MDVSLQAPADSSWPPCRARTWPPRCSTCTLATRCLLPRLSALPAAPLHPASQGKDQHHLISKRVCRPLFKCVTNQFIYGPDTSGFGPSPSHAPVTGRCEAGPLTGPLSFALQPVSHPAKQAALESARRMLVSGSDYSPPGGVPGVCAAPRRAAACRKAPQWPSFAAP